MHVFHIKGFSGILLLSLAILASILVALLLPAAFLMVLWNASIFEAFKGPEIDLYQGFLLWGALAVMIKVVFKPEFQLEFIKPSQKNGKSTKSNTTQEKPTDVLPPDVSSNDQDDTPVNFDN